MEKELKRNRDEEFCVRRNKGKDLNLENGTRVGIIR